MFRPQTPSELARSYLETVKSTSPDFADQLHRVLAKHRKAATSWSSTLPAAAIQSSGRARPLRSQHRSIYVWRWAAQRCQGLLISLLIALGSVLAMVLGALTQEAMALQQAVASPSWVAYIFGGSMVGMVGLMMTLSPLFSVMEHDLKRLLVHGLNRSERRLKRLNSCRGRR